MNIPQVQAQLAELQAETMRLCDESRRIARQERWLSPFLYASAWLAVVSAAAAFGVQAAKLFMR